MRAKFFLIFALLATTALTASITEQSLKALSDAAATAPATPKQALVGAPISYSICDQALTFQYFRKIDFSTNIVPKVNTDFLIYFDTVAVQPLTIIGLEVDVKYLGLKFLTTTYEFDPPYEVPPNQPYKITEKFAKTIFSGKFGGRGRFLGPGGKEIGCIDFNFEIAA